MSNLLTLEKNLLTDYPLFFLAGIKDKEKQSNRKENNTMGKFNSAKMNEAELEQVAGGNTYWYLRITGTYKDPATGRMFKDGYLVRGKDPETGRASASFWISAAEWKDWRADMEWRGHVFREGDSNPNNVDKAPGPAPATPKK
jgi:hypothetical protein